MRPPASRRDAGFFAAAGAAYVVLTCLYLGSLTTHFATHIAPDPGDPLLNLALMEWGSRHLPFDLAGVWDPTFFHPNRRVLTLSDHLLGPAAVFGAARRFLGSAGAYNLLFFGSYALSAFFTCYVVRRSGHRRATALLAGVMLGFAPFRWDQRPHLQLLLMQWIPPTLWFGDRFLATRRVRDGLIFLAFYALHVTGGNYLAFMIHVPLAVLLLNRLLPEPRRLLERRFLTTAIPIAAVAIGLALAVFLPYRHPTPGVRLERSESDYQYWGATLASFVVPGDGSRLLGRLAPGLTRPENALFPGLIAGGFAVWGLAVAHRRHRSPPARPLTGRRRWTLRALLLVAAATYALADALTWQRNEPLRLPGGMRLEDYDRPGIVFLAALLLWIVLRRRWGGNYPWRLGAIDPWRRGIVAGGAASFLLAHPLVFAPVSRLLPGLAGMRVPSRFHAFLLLAVAVAAAVGLDDLASRLTEARARRSFFAVVAAALLVESAPPRLGELVSAWPHSRLPAVYHWLARAPGIGAVAHLPAGGPGRDVAYLQGWTIHWRPLVNGFSGHIPPSFERLVQVCAYPSYPIDAACLDHLQRLGTTHLVVDARTLRPGQRRRFLAGEALPAVWTEEARARLSPLWVRRRFAVFRLEVAPP